MPVPNNSPVLLGSQCRATKLSKRNSSVLKLTEFGSGKFSKTENKIFRSQRSKTKDAEASFSETSFIISLHQFLFFTSPFASVQNLLFRRQPNPPKPLYKFCILEPMAIKALFYWGNSGVSLIPKFSKAFLVLFLKYPSEGFKQKSFGLQSSVFQTSYSQKQIWFWSESWSSEEPLEIMVPKVSLDNFKSGRLHTLITSAFSHIDIEHIVSNMIGLYFFGYNIGRIFGPEYLLRLYLAGAMGGSVFYLVHHAFLAKGQATWMMDPSRTPGLGASGAVNAIMLLDIFLNPKATLYFDFIIPVPAMLLGIFLIGKDILRIIEGNSHISGSAHLGGAAVAAIAWARLRRGRF
ncbi:hypothetical protein GOBAR_AA31872 [Gossypium barbadense]|uniref:Peptidase S54 rhomboid domain-containing protein n=1 Tax=Gossypium barbadense TaxID=3634 RepID=A0A2P5WCJ7_GOSBA|nr:hypothetical protein GOBAR_AA31872 [Gossypium barbadense]